MNKSLMFIIIGIYNCAESLDLVIESIKSRLMKIATVTLQYSYNYEVMLQVYFKK